MYLTHAPPCPCSDPASSRNTFSATSTSAVTIANHNRGFKGAGPAKTEAEDNFACTIHSRECLGDTFGAAADGVDAAGRTCVYGRFKVRLNASPGTKLGC